MDNPKEQAKQGASGVQSADKKRHNQAANVNTVCPGCGVYPGQIHSPDCECQCETTERKSQ
jgi:hypothetical protein